MKGWKWNPKIHDWDIVEIKLPQDFGKINAEETETLLQRAKMSEYGRQRKKLLHRSSKTEGSRL